MKKLSLFFMTIVIVMSMHGCSSAMKELSDGNINIVPSISSEEIVRSPMLDEYGKGNFVDGDILSLVVSNPEKNYFMDDYIVGVSDFRWNDLNISSSNGRVCFSACYPKQEIKNGKFIFDMATSKEKDLLLAHTENVVVDSSESVYLNFMHAMHKLVILYSTDEDLNISTQCTALSVCEVDMIENSLKVRDNEEITTTKVGKDVSFLVVPQRTSDITLNIEYGNKSKTYNLNELIKDYEILQGGKRFTLNLNIKNGDIQIENPVIGNWGEQGSVNDDLIM